MKTLLPLIALLFTVTLSAKTRREKHVEAAEIFTNWHFFENGRGMTISPNLSKLMWMLGEDTREMPSNFVNADPFTEFIVKRYGFIERDGKLMGVFKVPYKGMEVGVLGCTACHSGRAAGIFVPGLGNKTIDSYKVGKDTYRVQKYWGIGKTDPDYKYVHKKALHFSKVASDPRIGNLTRGLVSDATITTFFYKEHGIPYRADMGRGQVKAPHLWGIKEKRPVGVFNDGSLSGDSYAWIFGAELFASDSAEHLRAVLPKIKWMVDDVLGDLLPPAYPFPIKTKLAKKGKDLFKVSCQGCHGEHRRDAKGHPIYAAPKVIPKHVIQTDPEKIVHITDEFVRLVRTSSLGDLLTFNEENIRKGYFAPKLWGIWARFPYLHNASVPNLYQLMVPAEKRSKIFSMSDAGERYRFNTKSVGLTLYAKRGYSKALRKAKKGDRDIYYVKRQGHSNEGHYFSRKFDRLSHEDRMAIIEYLKTL